MKSYLAMLRAFVGIALASCFIASAAAQVVSVQPQFVAPRGSADLGNGPIEIRLLQGQMGVFTSLGTGVGSTSGSSTTLTLTATAAANPPCVGCGISGTGITAGTTVAAFNGTTGITLSAAMTVAASTPIAWGVACPTTGLSAPPQFLMGANTPDLPLYTYARICVAGHLSSGGQFVTFAIGAH